MFGAVIVARGGWFIADPAYPIGFLPRSFLIQPFLVVFVPDARPFHPGLFSVPMLVTEECSSACLGRLLAAETVSIGDQSFASQMLVDRVVARFAVVFPRLIAVSAFWTQSVRYPIRVELCDALSGSQDPRTSRGWNNRDFAFQFRAHGRSHLLAVPALDSFSESKLDSALFAFA